MSESNSQKGSDVTGRQSLLKNTLVSWAGHLVFIIAGFIMPRIIDDTIGQSALGIWDFGWSIVSYLRISGLGFTSSVTRYVGTYRAAGEFDKLRGAVTTVAFIQVCMALLVATAVIGLYFLLPTQFADKLAGHTEEAQWVVLFLGLGFSFELALQTSRGVITGYHKWGLQNGIASGFYTLNVICMIIALKLGGGLKEIAMVYFIVTLMAELTRVTVVFKVCPEMRIAPKLASMAHAKTMFNFGGKTLITDLVPILSIQTVYIFLLSNLGPASLAVFARPFSLIRHVETFMKKFAHVLVPTVGAVQQSGKLKELQDLLFSAAKYAAALALTMMIPFVVFGDVLMQVWMGSDYVNIPLIVLLGCGFFLPISQQPSFRFLMGMNEHGYIAMRAALAFVASLSIGIPILDSIGWSLDRAAWIVLVPELLAYGILVPIHASRVLQIPLWRYLHRAFGVPLLCALPYLLTLLGIKMAMPESPVSAMGYGALAGGLVLFVMFWLLLFPEKVKRKFQKLLPAAAR